ncbi:methylmalonyl-CoA epimerase [Halobacteriales archaeon QS_5_70_15]|jgi:methylmalonyl-CoA/ethylmalonyl-CoA epimerase|nr:MAG: methylmalonyl-CoA epimerase [Halobacteriales archaeon QS_5_70_15]
MQFDHAGIATRDADSVVFLFEDLLGVEVAHREWFDGMKLVFLAVGEGYLEIIEPTDEDGTVAGYLDREGPGIHHLAFATDDIEAALSRADDRGIERIDEEPRQGAWGHTVAFLHPRDTGGVLVEFVEH